MVSEVKGKNLDQADLGNPNKADLTNDVSIRWTQKN